MDFSNLSDRDLYNLYLNRATLNQADRDAILAEYNARNNAGNFNPNRSTVQPAPIPVPESTGVVDVQPPAGYYESQELAAKNAGANQPVQPPAYLQDVPQNEALGNQKTEAGNIAARDNAPTSPDAYSSGLQLFDDWVKTVPPEQLAQYETPLPEQAMPAEVPDKAPVNNRQWTAPAQKPAGMPSRVWEQLNPSQSTETVVTTINPEPTASQQNPYLGPTVQDPKSYTLENMDKLKTPEQLAEEEEKAKKTMDKIEKSEEKRKQIKDKVTDLSQSEALSDGATSAAAGAASMLADAAQFAANGIDPSGESTYAREQADIQAKQAALMDARRQAADRIWNRDLKAEADKKAAAGAAAENAQRIANTAAGESTVGQRGIKAADYNYEEQRADTARKEGTELSKDANQYQMAAIQRQADAAGIDYDSNRQRGIDNATLRLNMGGNAAAGNTKSNTGTTPMPGETPDKKPAEEEKKQQEEEKKQEEATSNTTPNTTPNNTQGGETKLQETAPTPVSTGKTANSVNFTDEAIKQREAARVGTSTPQTPAGKTVNNVNPTDEAIKQREAARVNTATSMQTKTQNYATALQNWASLVSKYTRSGQISHDPNAIKEIEAARKEAESRHATGLPSYNLGDQTAENVSKIWKQIQAWQKRFGGN